MMTTIKTTQSDSMQNAVDLFILDELVRVWNAERRISDALACPAGSTADLSRDMASLHARMDALEQVFTQLEGADARPAAVAA